MNRERLIDINNFLTVFKEELLKKPDLSHEINLYTNVYYHLVRCNTKEDFDNSDMFYSWIDNNDRDNTSVYVSPSWTYFCQFVSQPELLFDSTKHHKIYLSLKSEYLEEGAERIFDYLNEIDIPHKSKIGKLSRDDQIVIRVGSHEACDKVIDFINSDPFIKEGKKTANPFAFQYRGVALATDGSVSYNSGISMIISKYLETMTKDNKVEDINVNTFIDYCTNYYDKYFVKKEDIRKVFDDFNVSYNDAELYKVVDYKYVLELFLKGLSNSFDYNHFIEFIEYKYETVDEQFAEFDKEFEKGRYIALFDELCRVMTDKYGQETGTMQIEMFMNTMNADYITRDFNLRNRVKNKKFVEYINNYLKNNNITLEEYISRNFFKFEDFMFLLEDNNTLKDCVKTTYDYHEQLFQEGQDQHNGREYAESALVLLLRDGNYNGFTRTNDARQTMMDNLTRDDVYEIVADELGINYINGDDLDDVCSKFVDLVLDVEKSKNI